VLQKLSVRASNGPDKLMKTVKNPVSMHLPVGSRRIATSAHCSQIKHPRDLLTGWPTGHHTTVVVGAMAHGSIEAPYADEWWAISSYSLRCGVLGPYVSTNAAAQG
jgi:rRNA small subunit pseudouridine methyltransferase Nep1